MEHLSGGAGVKRPDFRLFLSDTHLECRQNELEYPICHEVRRTRYTVDAETAFWANFQIGLFTGSSYFA
jgi:hypothetical protein